MYHRIRLWEQGTQTVNLALAYPVKVSEPWAVITDETLTLETLWQYDLRFRVEELFFDSKSGVFGLTNSRLRDVQKLNRLYLITNVSRNY